MSNGYLLKATFPDFPVNDARLRITSSFPEISIHEPDLNDGSTDTRLVSDQPEPGWLK